MTTNVASKGMSSANKVGKLFATQKFKVLVKILAPLLYIVDKEFDAFFRSEFSIEVLWFSTGTHAYIVKHNLVEFLIKIL